MVTDWHVVAGALLVGGPLLLLASFWDPGLWRVWTAPRAEHLAMVRAHRRGWSTVNAGFFTAAVLSATGLAILALTIDVAAGPRVVLVAAAAVYAAGSLLWCAIQAIRTRVTPALADMVAAATPTEPVETLVGAVIGGLFAAFVLATSVALIAAGLVLVAAGGIAAPVAWFAVVIGVVAAGQTARGGDVIPAVLYFPTLALGIALLAGW